MHDIFIDQVHTKANLMAYDLELDSVRHPVRFFKVNDILRAAGESVYEEQEIPLAVTQPINLHPTSCHCRFCETGLFDTRLQKRLP